MRGRLRALRMRYQPVFVFEILEVARNACYVLVGAKFLVPRTLIPG